MQDFVLPRKQAVTLTQAAVSHFDNIADGKIVKLAVEGGGCAGFQYAWKILDDSELLYDDDEVIDYPHFKFAVDGSSIMFLVGSTVDYQTDITGSHIDIVNPIAKAGCGCGVSINF